MNRPDALDKFKKYLHVLKDINTRVRTLEAQKKDTKLNIIEDFRAHINQRRNIDALLSFFDTFVLAKKSTEKELHKLEKAFGDTKAERYPLCELKMLRDEGVLASVCSLIKASDTLKCYEGIKIVSIEREFLHGLIEKAIDAMKRSFFVCFQKVQGKGVELEEFSSFLVENTDKEAFISEYTSTFYSMVGFHDIGTSTELLLERTKDLAAFFSYVIETNNRILGEGNSEVTNAGMIKMLVLGLKKIMIDNLVRIEKEEDVSMIPFLMDLNERLGPACEEMVFLRELLVLKSDIGKIICNSLLGYFERLDMLQEPNKHGDAESFCLDILHVLDAFCHHKSIAEAFIETHGKVFGVGTVGETCSLFIKRVLSKMLLLADSFQETKKCVYIINNIHSLMKYTEGIGETSPSETIDENVGSILSIWREGLGMKEDRDVMNFLNERVREQREYFLPERIRRDLISKIFDVIENALARKKYSKSIGEVRNGIEELYSAKRQAQ